MSSMALWVLKIWEASKTHKNLGACLPQIPLIKNRAYDVISQIFGEFDGYVLFIA